jgi:uncharacterized protein
MKKSVFYLIFLAFANVNCFSQQFKILVFTKTEGFRHESILEGVAAIRQMANRHNFNMDWEEKANVFTDKTLEKYACIVFLNTSGNVLNDAQQLAMEHFIKNGKGFVGVHSASNTEYDWPWYNKMVGMMFKMHPQQQTANLNILTTDFPGMERFPKKLIWTDEWYEWESILATDLTYLIKVDEKSYNPNAKRGDRESKGMGDFHPIAWYHNYDGGRSFFTALGHIPLVYSDSLFLEHLYGGIYWAATGKGL